jgi:hypothetical protein
MLFPEPARESGKASTFIKPEMAGKAYDCPESIIEIHSLSILEMCYLEKANSQFHDVGCGVQYDG